MTLDAATAELHNSLYQAATEILTPYFEPAGDKRPVALAEIASVRRACALLERVVAIHPANWNAQWVMGMAYRSVGDYNKSHTALSAAYQFEQANPDIARELCAACLIIGHDQEAVRVAEEVSVRTRVMPVSLQTSLLRYF